MRRVSGPGPGILFLGGLDVRAWAKTAPSPDDPVSTARLRRRLAAPDHALGDIPRQARRVARLLAKQKRPIRQMRPEPSPGFRTGDTREIDAVLMEYYTLALIAIAEQAAG